MKSSPPRSVLEGWVNEILGGITTNVLQNAN